MKTKQDYQVRGVSVCPGKLLSAGAALLLSAALTFGQAAQRPSTEAAKDDVIQMEKYNVTGSYIPYAAEAPAVPIQIISAAQIEDTGEFGDLLQVIQSTVPQFFGNGNLGSTNSNIGGNSTNGGSKINLRNVQTLVLIDGRRAAYAPVAATGGYSFVDVNSIPVSAVERIEVLTDGASAIYGTDAVGGVVNIILKKDFEGIELGGGIRFATRDQNWSTRNARAMIGKTIGKTSYTLSLDIVKTSKIFQDSRPFSKDQRGKTLTFPGVIYDWNSNDYYVRTGADFPPSGEHYDIFDLVDMGIYKPLFDPATGEGDPDDFYNLASDVTLAMGIDKVGITSTIEHRFNDKLQAFGSLLYSRTEAFYQLAAQPIVGYPDGVDFSDLGDATPDNPLNPTDYYVAPLNRFVDHPRQYENKNHSLRLLAGLRGEINKSLSWEGAINYNYVTQISTEKNVIDRPVFVDALNRGLINLFDVHQDPVKMQQANIFGTARADNVSSLFTADFRVNGDIPVIKLPGGVLQYAAGVEYRHEALKSKPDEGSRTITDPDDPYYTQCVRWEGALTSDPFDASRHIESIYAQVRLPITSPQQRIPGLYTLELDAAIRYERYSDVSDPVVPRFLLRYLPINNELAFRATYSRSFTAPDLFALLGPAGSGFTNSVPSGGLEKAGGGTFGSGQQANLASVNPPSLDPEKSENYNVGVVYSPKYLKGLTVEAGFFSIKQTGFIAVESPLWIIQDTELRGSDSPLADRVRIGGFNGTPITAPGQISSAGNLSNVYVTNFAENFGIACQHGYDVTIRYVFDIESIGKFDIDLNGIYLTRFSVEDDDYLGETNGSGTLNGGTIARWHAFLRASWQRKTLRAGFYFEHIPSVVDNRSGQDVASYQEIGVWSSYEIPRGKLKGIKFRLSVSNLLDRMPPTAPSTWTDAGADIAVYGWAGRTIGIDVSKRF